MDISIIGKQIANGRKDKDMSQAELAEMLYVTPQTVSKWERGESLPDVFMLAKIADIFNVFDLGYFLNVKCNNFTTMEQFVEYWNSCSVKGLQKIASEHGVLFFEKDSKEMLVQKLIDGMNEYCKNDD